MSKRHLASLLLLLALISSMGWQNSLAQTGGEEYFEETRHSVKGEFYSFYYSFPDPLYLFGYPITSAFIHPDTNQMVQYFQKARFEYYPEAPEGQRIRLSPLGFFLYKTGDPVLRNYSTAGCRAFDTGYKVCYAFLDFYDANGGAAVFGPPISNFEKRNGVTVQHFLNARFEFHPEYPAGKKVTLSNLGYEYFFHQKENPRRLAAEPDNLTIQGAPKGILQLQARAYPLTAVTPREGKQTIYVLVQDQTLTPVEGAQVTVEVRMPSGEKALYIVRPQTNAKGVTQFAFPFSTDQVGIVQITIKATRDNLEAKTTTSFRIWW